MTKPKLTTDEKTENVKLAAEMLNDVSRWLIDQYKMLYFNGDIWIQRNNTYVVMIPEHFQSWINKDFPLLTPRQIDVVIKNCKNWLDYETEDMLKNFKNKVFFTNGIYDLEEGTFERCTIDKMGFSPNIIPYDYRSFSMAETKVDKFQKLNKLLNIFGQFDEELVNYLLEIIGSSMSMQTPFAKFVVFFGDGNNGKSTLLKLLTRTIGNKNATTFSLGRLTDKNKSLAEIMSFYGKTFVYDPDSAFLKIKDMSDIKQLTGGDEVTGRQVYGLPKKFVNYSTIAIMTNKVPRITETSRALDRRFGLYPLTKDIDNLAPEQKLTIKELDAIIDDHEVHQMVSSLALNAFHKAVVRGELSQPRKLLAQLKTFKSNNNDVYRWILEENIMEDIQTTGDYDPEKLFANFEGWNIREKTNINWSRKGFTQQFNTTIKNEFKLEIEPTQSRENGIVKRKYTIISKEIAKAIAEAH